MFVSFDGTVETDVCAFFVAHVLTSEYKHVYLCRCMRQKAQFHGTGMINK